MIIDPYIKISFFCVLCIFGCILILLFLSLFTKKGFLVSSQDQESSNSGSGGSSPQGGGHYPSGVANSGGRNDKGGSKSGGGSSDESTEDFLPIESTPLETEYEKKKEYTIDQGEKKMADADKKLNAAEEKLSKIKKSFEQYKDIYNEDAINQTRKTLEAMKGKFVQRHKRIKAMPSNDPERARLHKELLIDARIFKARYDEFKAREKAFNEMKPTFDEMNKSDNIIAKAKEAAKKNREDINKLKRGNNE